MIPFTTETFQTALVKVFARATEDKEYRERCMNDAFRALNEVEPDLAVPESFQFRFFEKKKDFIHSFLLPPYLEEQNTRERVYDLLTWAVCNTHPTPTH